MANIGQFLYHIVQFLAAFRDSLRGFVFYFFSKVLFRLHQLCSFDHLFFDRIVE